MKKTMILPFILALFGLIQVACVKNDANIKFTKSDIEPFLTTKEFTVPVRTGYYSMVTCCGDTLCITDTANTTIWVPKNKDTSSIMLTGHETTTQTKAFTDEDGILVSYYPVDAKTYWNKFSTKKLWQTVAFEDSKDIDYDYNDLIIHIDQEIVGGKFKVGIHPIAYGAQKTIVLGLIVYQDDVKVYDEIVSNDCKTELFEGRSGTGGYINTKAYDYHYLGLVKKLTICSANDFKGIQMVWWIKTTDKNDIIYAVNSKTSPNDLLNSKGLPYGIVITYMNEGYDDGISKEKVGYNWFFYPKETINVWKYYEIKNGVFQFKTDVEGPDVNDFILINPPKDRLYSVPNRNL